MQSMLARGAGAHGMGEFELIRRYFDRHSAAHEGVVLGIGDDCALLAPRAGYELAISTDMLVAGRHFFADVDAATLGWKALAVNLSDLAAMGALPRAFTLALSLPEAVPEWLETFSRGLFECAFQFECPLIGGDTTRGPLNLCITIFGEVPSGVAIRRSGAQAGDDLWVSGQLGEAALGLRLRRGDAGLEPLDALATRHAINALELPMPRVALGLALRGVATAMLDVSDGLLGDLEHVLAASALPGARIHAAALPLSAGLLTQPEAVRLQCALAGGDDYELCFTAPASQRARIGDIAARSGTPLSLIGTVGLASGPAGIQVLDTGGQVLPGFERGQFKGYDHFGNA